jgi:hypothetical protein
MQYASQGAAFCFGVRGAYAIFGQLIWKVAQLSHIMRSHLEEMWDDKI